MARLRQERNKKNLQCRSVVEYDMPSAHIT